MSKLGVNIDHVATLRQARKGLFPNLVEASIAAEAGGADGITVHIREDRRHIQDKDLSALKRVCQVPLNVELSLAPEIIRIVLALLPQKVCFVPERRQEVTTEGGLNVITHSANLKKEIPKFLNKKIEVSLFIDPSFKQVEMSAKLGASAIEIHTGAYSHSVGIKRLAELSKIKKVVKYARSLGLKVHAGHGLDYQNVKAIAAIPGIEELNIGHSIISRAIFIGMKQSVVEMKRLVSSN